MKRLWMAALFLFLAASPLPAADPVIIGLSSSLTGRFANLADMPLKGFLLWERDVNQRGGLLGRTVRLLVYDDKSDPKTVAQLYEQIISRDKADLIFCPYSSELTEAILPVTEKHHYPLIASGATSDRLWRKGYRYVFGNNPVASRYTSGFIETLVRNRLNDVAIFYVDDVFGREVGGGAKQWVEKFGLRPVQYTAFQRTRADYEGMARSAQDAGAQVVIMCGHFDEAVGMRLALKRISWYPKAFFASTGPSLPNYSKKLRADADYTFSAAHWEHTLRIPGAEVFYKSFRHAYGKAPSYQAAMAYSAGQLLEQAVKRAGSLDRKAIRDILARMETMTIVGRYGVDRKTGMQIKQFSIITQWQKGQREIIWPEEFKTAPPLFR